MNDIHSFNLCIDTHKCLILTIRLHIAALRLIACYNSECSGHIHD